MAKKICDLYGFTNRCIPGEFKSKDPSDLIKNTGVVFNLCKRSLDFFILGWLKECSYFKVCLLFSILFAPA